MEVAWKEATSTITNQPKSKLWMPKQVLFTPAALEEPWGQQIYERVQALGLPVQELKQNRITGLRGENERETYRKAKSTLAIVTAPASALICSWLFNIFFFPVDFTCKK
jgi:spore photoproduct lyase